MSKQQNSAGGTAYPVDFRTFEHKGKGDLKHDLEHEYAFGHRYGVINDPIGSRCNGEAFSEVTLLAEEPVGGERVHYTVHVRGMEVGRVFFRPAKSQGASQWFLEYGDRFRGLNSLIPSDKQPDVARILSKVVQDFGLARR